MGSRNPSLLYFDKLASVFIIVNVAITQSLYRINPSCRPRPNCWTRNPHGWWSQHRENRWGPGEGSCCRLQGLVRQRCLPRGITLEALHDRARSWVHWACTYLMSPLNIWHLIFQLVHIPLHTPVTFRASEEVRWLLIETHVFYLFFNIRSPPRKSLSTPSAPSREPYPLPFLVSLSFQVVYLRRRHQSTSTPWTKSRERDPGPWPSLTAELSSSLLLRHGVAKQRTFLLPSVLSLLVPKLTLRQT